MKLTQKVTSNLAKANEANLLKDGVQPKKDIPELAVLQLIAQLLDAIAEGEQMFMIIGATTRKDAFTLTVKHNDQPTTVYGNSLVELSLQAKTLL